MTSGNNFGIEYQKGYEEGYRMTRYLPDIARWLANRNIEIDRYRGFRDGRIDYLTEQVLQLAIDQDQWDWDEDE